jgi:hypothetical protein
MQPSNIPSEKTARRVGSCVSIIILVFVLACAAGVWFLFNRERIHDIQTTLNLQFNGETTTGTVTDLEAFEGSNPQPQTHYRLTVEYNVDGTTYSITSGFIYPPLDHSWEGETMEVIYDPADPAIAMINNPRERWFIPLTGRQ